MKYLKIEDSKGLFWNGDSYVEIDKINKENLLNLLDFAENDDFEMDEYNEETLQNKAHQIIYENIFEKLNSFLCEKDLFMKEVESLYKDAIGEYSRSNTRERNEIVQEEE